MRKDKEAIKAYHKIWYAKNKGVRIALVKKNKIRIKKFIDDIKRVGSCADCTYANPDHPETLDFDHINGEKEINIAAAANKGWSLDRIKKEIEKCVLRCANCHRIKTKERLLASQA